MLIPWRVPFQNFFKIPAKKTRGTVGKNLPPDRRARHLEIQNDTGVTVYTGRHLRTYLEYLICILCYMVFVIKIHMYIIYIYIYV